MLTTAAEKRSICLVATTGKQMSIFLLPQAKYLADHGWRVTLASSGHPQLAAKLPDNVEFVELPMRRGVEFFSIPLRIFRLYRLFKRGRFNFVQYFMPNAAFYASIAGKLAKVPHRYYQMGGLRYSASTGLKRRVLMWLDKFSCRASTAVIAVSRGNLAQAVADGIYPASKAKVIWHGGSKGVDLQLFNLKNKERWREELRSLLGIAPDDVVIGFAGSIRRDKGLEELFAAFAELRENCRAPLKLLLVGDRDYYHTISGKSAARAEADPNVIFVPPLSPSPDGVGMDEVPKLMACFDILGFASHREGLPNAVLEAQALAIPVVAADVPGTADAMVDGSTGLLVPVKDPSALASALRFLAENSAKRAEMGKNGRIFVENNFNQAILMAEFLREKEAAL